MADKKRKTKKVDFIEIVLTKEEHESLVNAMAQTQMVLPARAGLDYLFSLERYKKVLSDLPDWEEPGTKYWFKPEITDMNMESNGFYTVLVGGELVELSDDAKATATRMNQTATPVTQIEHQSSVEELQAELDDVNKKLSKIENSKGKKDTKGKTKKETGKKKREVSTGFASLIDEVTVNAPEELKQKKSEEMEGSISDTIDAVNHNAKMTDGLVKKVEKIQKTLSAARIKKLFSNATALNKLVDKQKLEKKAKPVKEKATKVDNVDSEDSLAILNKILAFMQKAYDDDKKTKEEELNFAEEKKLEKDKKDKEFLEALKARKGGDQTAEKIEKEGGTNNMLGDILDAFGGVGKAVEVLFKIGKFFLSNPIGIALLAGASLMALLARDKDPEATNQGMQNAGKADGGVSEAITKLDGSDRRKAILLREAHKNGIIKASWYEFKKTADEENAYLKKIGFDPKTGLTDADRDKGFNFVDPDTGEASYSKFYDKSGNLKSESTAQEAPAESTSKAPTATPVSPPAASSGGAAASVPAASAASDEKPAATASAISAPKATPEPSPTPGAKLNAVTNENADNKLMEDMQAAMAPMLNETTNLSQQSAKSSSQKPLPAVRNQEETFQRMIYGNTRVV